MSFEPTNISPTEIVPAEAATPAPLAPAPSAPLADPWSKALRYVQAAQLFQRASLAAQIMAGMELVALHKQWNVKRGGDRRSNPHDAGLNWEDSVKQELGISADTASRWMEMAKAARKRLEKSELDLGDILEKSPSALTPAEQELLKSTVHKISDGQTQLEFLLECGVTKVPQGGGARGGNTGGRRSTTFTAEMQAEARRAATKRLIDLLTEELTEQRFTSADTADRKKLHGLLVDLSAAVGATV